MRGLQRHRPARIISAGHAFVQNHRRGHYELATDVPACHRIRAAGLPRGVPPLEAPLRGRPVLVRRGRAGGACGGGAEHLAGHLGWGHPLLFTLISDCGYAVLAACVSVAVVVANRSARRDRRAGMQERSDREQSRL
jgi:hypothetical protein